MTFDAFEISAADGQPVELYEFGLGNETFRFTSTEDVIVDGSLSYSPIEISRSQILLGSEQRKDVVTATMPAGTAPASRYAAIVPGQKLTLTIKRLHRTDGGSPQAVTIFKGEVRAVAYTRSNFEAQLSVVPLSQGLSREAPRFTYQGLCNHILYDSRCTVSQSGFQFDGPVAAVSGAVITVTGANGKVDGFYDGGFAQLGTSDFRLILSHVGNDLTLLLAFPSDITGSTISIFAGCDHTIATCKTKFDNVANYGGFAFVPLKNPFETRIN